MLNNISIDIHPSGLYLLVCFSDCITLKSILIDDIVQIWEETHSNSKVVNYNNSLCLTIVCILSRWSSKQYIPFFLIQSTFLSPLKKRSMFTVRGQPIFFVCSRDIHQISMHLSGLQTTSGSIHVDLMVK
jgi:hypothetical protein